MPPPIIKVKSVEQNVNGSYIRIFNIRRSNEL